MATVGILLRDGIWLIENIELHKGLYPNDISNQYPWTQKRIIYWKISKNQRVFYKEV